VRTALLVGQIDDLLGIADRGVGRCHGDGGEAGGAAGGGEQARENNTACFHGMTLCVQGDEENRRETCPRTSFRKDYRQRFGERNGPK
jgi:hypothetical protein